VAHVISVTTQLVEAKEQGIAPSGLRYARQAGSVHNNYFTLPVLFIMISNSHPMTYGARYGWVALLAITAALRVTCAIFSTCVIAAEPVAIPVTALLATLRAADPDGAGQAGKHGGWPPPFAKCRRSLRSDASASAESHAGRVCVAPKNVLLNTPI